MQSSFPVTCAPPIGYKASHPHFNQILTRMRSQSKTHLMSLSGNFQDKGDATLLMAQSVGIRTLEISR